MDTVVAGGKGGGGPPADPLLLPAQGGRVDRTGQGGTGSREMGRSRGGTKTTVLAMYSNFPRVFLLSMVSILYSVRL